MQAKAVAGDSQEDSKQRETAQTVTGTAKALPVPQVKELPPAPYQRTPSTSETDKDLQREVNKVIAETARLNLQLLLKEKQRILKHKREQLEALVLPKLHVQRNPWNHPNNAALGITRPQSNTSMAEILMAKTLAQQSAKETKTIWEKFEKELREWIWILDSYFKLRKDDYPTNELRVTWAENYLEGQIADIWDQHLQTLNDDADPSLEYMKNFLRNWVHPAEYRQANATRKYKKAKQGQSESIQQLFMRKEAIHSKLSPNPVKFCAQMFIEMLRVDIQNKICNRSKQSMNMTTAASAALHIKSSLRNKAEAIQKEPKPSQKKQRQPKNTLQRSGKDCS